MSKKVLIIGDIHTGSRVAPMPNEVRIDEGTSEEERKFPNAIQKTLNKEWDAMCDTIGKVDIAVVNGDLVEGVNRKASGMGLWTTEVGVQIEACADLLSMINTPVIYGTSGSPYHSGQNPYHDFDVIKKVGDKYHRKSITGYEASFKIGGVRFYCAHKTNVSKTTWQYRTTPIARDLLLAEINQMDFGKHDIICRSHAHYYCGVQFGTKAGFILPGWKGRDEYVKMSAESLSYNPAIGYLLFEVDNGDYSWSKYITHLKNDMAMQCYDFDRVVVETPKSPVTLSRSLSRQMQGPLIRQTQVDRRPQNN